MPCEPTTGILCVDNVQDDALVLLGVLDGEVEPEPGKYGSFCSISALMFSLL